MRRSSSSQCTTEPLKSLLPSRNADDSLKTPWCGRLIFLRSFELESRESLSDLPLVLGRRTAWRRYEVDELFAAVAFNNQTWPTVVWTRGCHGSSFVDPNQNTFAHGLWLQSDGGLPPCSALAI